MYLCFIIMYLQLLLSQNHPHKLLVVDVSLQVLKHKKIREKKCFKLNYGELFYKSSGGCWI